MGQVNIANDFTKLRKITVDTCKVFCQLVLKYMVEMEISVGNMYKEWTIFMVSSDDIKGHFYIMERSHLIDCYSFTLGVTTCFITKICKY